MILPFQKNINRGGAVTREFNSAVAILLFVVMIGFMDFAVADTSKRINNVFYSTDLSQALMDVSAEAGIPIVAATDVSGFITCELIDVSLDRALKIMLAGTGYTATWVDGMIIVASVDPRSRSYWQVTEPRRVPLNYLAATTAQQLLPDNLRPYVNPDPAGHCLSVVAPREIIEKIETVLSAIDLPPRQIMLEARIVVMQKSGSARLGTAWDWPSARAGARTDDATWSDIAWVATAGLTPAGELTNSLMVNLDFLAANDEATTVANPRVLAYEGREARIAVLTEEYFKILTEDFYQRSTLEKVETGILLKLTPRIGDGGDISMDIETEVSDVIARGDQDLPVVTRRTTKSRALVPDQGTIVISGLTDQRERSSKRKVPLLGHLPLLGRLFTQSVSEKRESQVAVFITPRIVEAHQPDVARIQTGRRRLAPVGQEFDLELAEAIARQRGVTSE